MFFITLISTLDFVNGNFFECLYNEHKNRIYGIARSICGNNEDAEDIVQETFIKIYRNLQYFHNLECKDSIPLIVIYTKNTARDFLRKKKRQVTVIDMTYDDDGEIKENEIPDVEPTPEEILINQEMVMFLGECVDSLTEQQRHLILLKYRYEMKDKEIARLMSISETAVSSRLNRIKEILRKKMEDNNK